jgi:hypothetical protein
MADENPKPQNLAPIHAAAIGQASLSSLLSPMNISPLTISPNFTPSVASPAVGSFVQQQPGMLNKFDATIVQMRPQGQMGPPGGDQTVRSPPPPIVSIPLPRE